jgi:VWFA-related protein
MRCFLIVAILASASINQAQAQGPIIRTEVREVVIDVTVTGKKGASAAGDLTAKDLSIWEDGKQQKINSVSSVAADPDASLKHFVIYFDIGAMSASDKQSSENAAADFVKGLASPDRYMAVVDMTTFGPKVLQDFTASAAALSKAVASVGQTRMALAGSQRFTLSDSLTAVCRSMAPATGRKALLLFGTSYTDTGAIGACNRANVAIYQIGNFSPSVGEPSPSLGHAPTILQTVQSMASQSTRGSQLSDETGGAAFGFSAALSDQLAGVAREQDEYYRVAYTPPAAKEGSCHAIKIAMNTRGLTARARNEYCTEKPVDVVAGKIAGQALEARAASAGAGTMSVAMQLPYFYTGANRASVRLSAEIVPARMKFEKDKNGLHGQLDIVATVLRPDGGTAARFADTVDIDQDSQASADQFTRTPYHYEHQFTVAAGTYTVQMAIGAGPSAVGKVEMPLKVDAWSAASLGMGGIAFSTGVRAADSADPAPGPVLEGRGPLMAGGKQFVPAAANKFTRSAPLYFYTEIYDAALAGANPPALEMQYRILDGKTGEARAESAMAGIGSYVRPGNPVVPFATRLQLAQLPAGSYRLEVRTQAAGSQEIAVRTIDFELE